jgi:UPF0042 nucleotide-binding protein
MVLDTTSMSVHDLEREIRRTFLSGPSEGIGMTITVLSFGYKHGVPQESDLVFDVRFLPNPYFVEELRDFSGEDDPVASYVLERDEAKAFLAKLEDLLGFLLPQYDREGKSYLTIAFGCTGGRHRSVAIAGAVGRWLVGSGRRAQVRHRDAARWIRKMSRA